MLTTFTNLRHHKRMQRIDTTFFVLKVDCSGEDQLLKWKFYKPQANKKPLHVCIFRGLLIKLEFFFFLSRLWKLFQTTLSENSIAKEFISRI